VDAVWAGWGHASEKDLLPDTLEKTPTHIAFIGPRGAPMRALGDKIGSTIIAQSAGVSCIGWNGDQLRCDYKNEGFIPQATYDQANVTTVNPIYTRAVGSAAPDGSGSHRKLSDCSLGRLNMFFLPFDVRRALAS
jgi:acetyl-CoA carboxylase/biotin carboxylase 1